MLELCFVGKGIAGNMLDIVPDNQLREISKRGKSGCRVVSIGKMVAIEMEIMHIGSATERIGIDGRDTASDRDRIQKRCIGKSIL